MCLILGALDVHPDYRLVVAANRDEFYDRPAEPVAWWPDEPRVLAGRDLRSGGTWLGVTRGGRFAAITNYREPGNINPDAPSRGGLVLASLTDDRGPARYMDEVQQVAAAYNGFNLLAGDASGLWICSNRNGAGPTEIGNGIFGLSNHLLNTPWPKVAEGCREFESALCLSGPAVVERLLEVLGDRTIAADEQLPNTGVGLEMERLLSSRFIVSPIYGTRASYVVLIGRNDRVTFVEQVFDEGRPSGPATTVEFGIRPR